MSTGIAHNRYDDGGMCYAACQEAFEWYNSSTFWCQKGCDFGRGRKMEQMEREKADNMCKMMASSTYGFTEGEDLENLADLRIHATMYSNTAANLYRACLAGVRR